MVGAGDGKFCQVFAFHGRKRPGHIAFLLHAVADYDHFVQCFGIFFQDDVQGGVAFYFYFLRLEADIGNDQCGTGGGFEGEVTVYVGDRPDRRALYKYVNP